MIQQPSQLDNKSTDAHERDLNKFTQTVTAHVGNKHPEWVQIPPLIPGGLYCHYWLLCEQGCRNAASCECCLVAATEGARASSMCYASNHSTVTHRPVENAR